MTTLSVICGVLLILIGVIGYGYGYSIGHASPTALIPAAFGVLIALFGAVGAAKPDIRKHVMHVAVLLGLIGFLIPAVRLLMKASEFAMTPAVISQLAMSLVCLVFVVFAVRSFIAARRGI